MNSRHNSRTIRALGLCSGGLDSILAALVLKEQGIEVSWVSFETPFFSADSARKASCMTGIPLAVEDITDAYMDLLRNPPAGFGKNMNPCMDCHAMMFRTAGTLMKERGFDFLFSGEVAGQRPFSQNKNSMRYVEKHSGFDGYILRPLSARILPETQVEKEGLVDRNLLCDISGRSRKVQMEMAERFGVTDYPAPAGGCLLTDQGFSRRLKDLMAHQDDIEKRELMLLKFGRHMRLNEKTRLVIGRSKGDNRNIQEWVDPEKDILIRHATLPSPTLVIPGGAPSSAVATAAAICAGYARVKPGEKTDIRITAPGNRSVISVAAMDTSESRQYLL